MSAPKRLNSPMKLHNERDSKKPKLQDESTKDTKETSSHEDNYDFLFDDDSFDSHALAAVEQQALPAVRLDLSKWRRCAVLEVERDRKTYDLILKLGADFHTSGIENGNPNTIANCRLQDQWSHINVEVNDFLSLQAIWDDNEKIYKVNKDNGFCVTKPDTLISGTTVVGSLFCQRKAVLQEHFRGIDANNKVMLVGTFVHELLQIVLSKGLKTLSAVERVAEELLGSQETAHTLYASQLTRKEMELEVSQFVPNIVSFVQQYIKSAQSANSTPPQKDQFQGCITEISDIEENLWVPALGLKGKVDASVRIQRNRHKHLKLEPPHAVPLELKTGRASFSMEHKGQLILYQMMLTATGRSVDSGLLLYLREGITREVHGARNEQRDLIMLRNNLAHYLSNKQLPLPTILESSVQQLNADGKLRQPLLLPDPILHHSACGNCAYATICCTFAKTDANVHLHDAHPLRKVMLQATMHLQPQDYEYFIHWCGLLVLEEQEARKSQQTRALWTETPEMRQKHGRAIIGLRLQENVSFEESRYLNTFYIDGSDADTTTNDLTLSGFELGEYVIVSSSKRLAIAAGCITELTKTTITISLERNLEQNYAIETFIVDKHESQSGNVFNYTNLGLLLEATECAAALRAFIIERVQPSYSKILPKVVATTGADVLQELNTIQRSAVLKALRTESFMLIKGLPGTGKTQTLVAIVRLLNLMGKTVLITSQTHSAIDNLLLRLKEHDLPMLRLGSAGRTHVQLRACSESELLKDCKNESELAAMYASYPIVGVTCLGAAHSIFLHRKFDYCIMDEATQVMQPTALRPLFFCEKFILVGDPAQLPPIIRSYEARQRGADESLFHRLDSDTATAVLTLQYRMNKTITKLANALTYDGALQCASDDVKMSIMRLKAIDSKSPKWLERTLQTHIDQSVLLLDTFDCSERSFAFASRHHSSNCIATIEQSCIDNDDVDTTATLPTLSPTKKKRRISKYTNYCDATVVFRIVKYLLEFDYDAERIGIIAPYRAQVELLRKLATQHHTHYDSTKHLNFAGVEVNTVDQYQGRDKDIIIYSCAKTGPVSTNDFERSRESEILEDHRRLTVAVTRSKYKLIIVGDVNCLQQYSPFKKLFANIPGYCKVELQDDKMDFNWQTLFAELAEVIDD